MKKNDEPIIVEQVFSAPIETVWTAITDIDHMRQWYFENIPAFKAEVGFETQFDVQSGERIFPHRWKITEVMPLKKIVYNWNFDGYPGDSFVVFELFKQNELTKLRLTLRVVETFPQDIPEFLRESCIGGWNFFLKERLKEFLEKD
jgi:uncharacterized protein YndB with AHSA1/START domain